MSLPDYTSYFYPDDRNGTETKRFFHFFNFLNTPRSGSAQSSAGISVRTFISSVMISLIICAFQTSVFSLLRCKLKEIYQPNCYYVPNDERIARLNEGFFSWIPSTVMHPLNEYLSLGMDAYFFLRYLCFLLVLFLGLACLNIPVLVPVNYTSGYDHYKARDLIKYTNGTIPKMVTGLDRISMSNIAPLFSKRLSIHLTITVISIFWFHGLVISELLSYVRIKNQYLMSLTRQSPKLNARDHSSTILVDNVPGNLLDKRELARTFSKLSGKRVKNIWFSYNYGKLKDLYEKHLKYLDQIETLESKVILSQFFDAAPMTNIEYDEMRFNHNRRLFKIRRLSDIRIHFIYRVVPKFYLQNNKSKLESVVQDYLQNKSTMQEMRALLIARERSPLNDQKYNKVFIQFEDDFQPHLFNQIQISDKLNELDNTLIFIDPKDLIWNNLSVQSNAQVFFRVLIANFLSIVIILGWVVPVAFIGLISQLPYLTVLVPFLSWLNYLPDYITDVISNFLSVILLVCLSETVPYIFRWLSYVKCKKTGAEIELDVQNWMFVFLFIHIFMVVTISSGLTVIVENLLNNPVSIPNILATNLPKCSNFFFSYLLIRGLSYFGNNLLQNLQLLKSFLITPFKDISPRRKFNRLTSIPSYKWGSIYPTFAVLGSIGLIYCILSPLILVFCCIAFLLVLISFKYSLKYQFNLKNRSENYGQFYPRAIFHLYSGIYFMEICLIGIFVLSKDQNNMSNCFGHAFVTFVLLILTAAGQIQIQKMFAKLLCKNIPLTLYEPDLRAFQQNETEDRLEEVVINHYNCGNPNFLVNYSEGPNENLHNDTFHHACFQHSNNLIWIPHCEFADISENEIKFLKNVGIQGTVRNAEINLNGDIKINSCPPDYIVE